MKKLSEDTIIIGPCRLSYMQVFSPQTRSLQQQDGKTIEKTNYSVTLLIPKGAHRFNEDPAADLQAVKEMTTAVAAKKFGPEQKTFKRPLRDGDSTGESGMDEPKHPGYWYMNATANVNFPPVLLTTEAGADGRPRTAKAQDWQSGDWGMAKVNFFDYTNVNRGVSCGLKGLQFTHVDDHFGGRKNTDEGFEAVAPKTVAADDDDPFADQ